MNNDKKEFDQYTKNYDDILNKSLEFSGYESRFFDERKIIEIYNFIKLQGTGQKTLNFLNFGCGIGKSEKFIAQYFNYASIFSVDISAKSIEFAQKNNQNISNLTFSTFDGHHIPFDHEFDIIMIANVFHHIEPSEHLAVLKHLHQKMVDGGYLFIFEHNPFNPLTRKVVNSCAFDKDVRLLNPQYTNKLLQSAGFQKRIIRFIHFIPSFLTFLMPLEKLLRKIPLGAQYYFIAVKQSKLRGK
jgi:SAM-dependent methyltransferase